MKTPRNLKNSACTLGASLAALAIASTTTAPGAYAASEGDVEVVNTETVQVYVEPDGSIESQRVYEQLTLTGSGTADIANPIEQEGLRNLNEFTSPEVEDGVQSFEVAVDGVERLRSVSEYTGELPLDIDVEYRLDGELVEPGDVVGAEGELEVLYTARNITAQPQEVTFPDGQGGTTTEPVEVPIPLVGSLTTVAPPSFTEVASDQANMAGDGKGGTKLSFTMTLFPPIGSDTAEFGYTAKISDGVVPSSSVSALPVNPLESPSFKTAGESYRSGSDTGVKLAEGATEIDTNLLKLRDGAAKLLAGLVKLSDGADELSAGLAGEAAPGARQLADGAGELDAGLTKIDDGAGQLADGAGRLADGSGDLDDGAGQLANGLSQAGAKAPALLDGLTQVRKGLKGVDAGLVELSGVLAPTVKNSDGYKQLVAGVRSMLNGVGSKDTADTLVWGVDQLRTRFTGAAPLIEQMRDGANCAGPILNLLNNGVGAVDPDNPCFAKIKALLASQTPPLPLAALGSETNPLRKAVLNTLSGSFVRNATSGPTPTLGEGLSALVNDLKRLDPNDPGVILALTKIECAMDSAAFDQLDPSVPSVIPGLPLRATCDQIHVVEDPNSPDFGNPALGLHQGLEGVAGGIPALVDGIADVVSQKVGAPSDRPKKSFRGAVAALIDGVGRIRDGGGDLLDGLGLLSDGAGRLAEGTGKLRAGARELSAGAGKLAAGTGEASDGSGRLADGADQLAEGLDEAADGSVRLADGMAEARNGAPALVDGAGRLSSEGMSQLIDAGEDTAQDYGKLYATIEAGAERAEAEKMAYGAPADAQGMTAYTYELLGDDGESGRNTKRGLTALGLLGLGGGAFLLRRRFA